MTIGVLHGPNLNLLGSREPHRYGTVTLEEIDAALAESAADLGVRLEILQSNHEGALVDWVQQHGPGLAGFVVNAAAFTHTSLALADALAAVDRPFVEVHLTNLAARSRTRRKSLLARNAVGVIMGFGAMSYDLGLQALVAHVRNDKQPGSPEPVRGG